MFLCCHNCRKNQPKQRCFTQWCTVTSDKQIHLKHVWERLSLDLPTFAFYCYYFFISLLCRNHTSRLQATWTGAQTRAVIMEIMCCSGGGDHLTGWLLETWGLPVRAVEKKKRYFRKRKKDLLDFPHLRRALLSITCLGPVFREMEGHNLAPEAELLWRTHSLTNSCFISIRGRSNMNLQLKSKPDSSGFAGNRLVISEANTLILNEQEWINWLLCTTI